MIDQLHLSKYLTAVVRRLGLVILMSQLPIASPAQITDNRQVLVLKSIDNVVGNGLAGSIREVAARETNLESPQSLIFDKNGNLYIADAGNHVIVMMNAITSRVSIIAGIGSPGGVVDDVPAKNVPLDTPVALALDATGNIYIADQGNHVVRRVDRLTNTITTLAGYGFDPKRKESRGGVAGQERFCKPSGIVIDTDGSVIVADAFDGSIRRIDIRGISSIIAGGGSQPGSDGFGDGGVGPDARLESPGDIALDRHGNIFVADTGHNLVRVVNAATHLITVVAGNGERGYSGDDGLATEASLNTPTSVRVDDAGNVVIVDAGNNAVREIDASTGIIKTIAGGPESGSSVEADTYFHVKLNVPSATTWDENGEMIVADSGSHLIRRLVFSRQSTQRLSDLSAATISRQTSNRDGVTRDATADLPLDQNSFSRTNEFHIGSEPQNVSNDGLASQISQQGSGNRPFNGPFDRSVTDSLKADSPRPAMATSPDSGFVADRAFFSERRAGLSDPSRPAQTDLPQVAVEPARLNMRSHTPSECSGPSRAVITNVGRSALTIRAFSLTGKDARSFTISSSCPAILPANASCSITVLFHPQRAGKRQASIQLHSKYTLFLPVTGQTDPEP